MIVKTEANLFIQSIVHAANEIMGSREAKRVLNAVGAFSVVNDGALRKDTPDFLSDLGNEFAIRFQRNTAKDLMERIGCASFEFLRKNGFAFRKFVGSEDNYSSPSTPTKDLLEMLARALTVHTGLDIRSFFQKDRAFFLEIDIREDESFSSDLYLFFFAGVLRAVGSWIDCGKAYSIMIADHTIGRVDHKRVYLKFLD